MSMKRPLIVTAVVSIVASAVHSQSLNPVDNGAQRAAPIFDDAQRRPSDRATALTAANVLADGDGASGQRRAVAPGGAQPFELTLPKPPAPVGDDGAANPSNAVDISALRYFASQNDLARVAAEIKLLRAKHPDWEPPADLFNESNNVEAEKPLWDLFAKHDYEGVRAAIADLQQNNPDWQPSADLAGKLSLAEANDNLVRASDAQQWGDVIDIAAGNKMLMTCGRIDAIWRTAEALIKTDDEARAVAAYRYILTSCGKPEERLATVQKASVLLGSSEELNGLLQLGRRLPNGKSEFESVRLDLVRRKIGDAAAGKPGAEVSQNEVDAVAGHARSANDLNDQQLLGWYNYARKDFVQAEAWFHLALQPGPNAKAAEGLVLTLRAEDRLPEAQRLAVQYAPLDPLNRKLMLEVFLAVLADPKSAPLSTEDTATFTKAIDDEHSADAAQIYGWRLYDANDFAGASGWFHKSSTWQPNESAAMGEVVTARRLNNMQDYAALIAKYRAAFPKIAEFDAQMRTRFTRVAARSETHSHARLARGAGAGRSDGGGWDKSADEIVKVYQDGNYEKTIAMLEDRKQHKGAEPGGLSVIRGWAMYKKGDWKGAEQAFAGAQSKGQAKEGEEGLSTVQRGYLPPVFR